MGALKGVIPPATTAFLDDESLDLDGVARQIDWLIGQGAHGVAVGGSTGEGHTLDGAEFRDLIQASVEASAGRAPVIAGIITDSTRDSVARGKAVSGLDVAALQVTLVHYLFRPHDDAMVDHFRRLTEETGMPVIIYNVVPWTYLSPALLVRIFNEVPGVIGVKQSAGDLKLLADLMLDSPPDKLIFSAVDALLYNSYTLGAHGSIAAILSAAPRASVDLWDAVTAGDHASALDLHGRLLRLWNAMVGDNLPACTKYAQTLQGCAAGRPRAPMPEPDEAQRRAVREALGRLVPLDQAAE